MSTHAKRNGIRHPRSRLTACAARRWQAAAVVRLLSLTTVLLIGDGRAAAEPPIRLLFAGSSSTYWNDLPHGVAEAVSGKIHGHAGQLVTAELVGRSGDDIRVYLEPGFNRYQYGVKPGQTFLQKIREERFDYVSLMAVCSFITRKDEGQTSHAEAISIYCDAIRAAGAEPIIYEMGWSATEMAGEGQQQVFDLAAKNKVRTYAPCSSAWKRVYEERPNLKLQHPNDGTHPGDLGHFLNLACFYAALTRTSPVGQLPRTYPVWPHFTKEEKEARRAELDRRSAGFEPNAYVARLPEWMRRNSAALDEVAIDEPTASYLETVAWETWRQVDARLKQAIEKQ